MRETEILAILKPPEQEPGFDSRFPGERRRLDFAVEPNERLVLGGHDLRYVRYDIIARGNENGRVREPRGPRSCPSWDRTRTLLIQSRAVRVCLEDTMSVSGCPPSIGARKARGQCPDWPGETLAKRL